MLWSDRALICLLWLCTCAGGAILLDFGVEGLTSLCDVELEEEDEKERVDLASEDPGHGTEVARPKALVVLSNLIAIADIFENRNKR